MSTVEWNSLHGALGALFPTGTVPKSRAYEKCPPWPTTVFGAVAYLLERGGVYHRIVHAPSGADAARFNWRSGNLIISPSEVEVCRALGERWYQSFPSLKAAGDSKDKVATELTSVFAEIEKLWEQLVILNELPVVSKDAAEELSWWLPALRLLIVADEASRDLGFGEHPIDQILETITTPDVYEVAPDPAYHVVHLSQLDTFAPRLNPMLARVVPKSRTPGVGCTMRALSHNLALVPPKGIVDMRWYRQLRPVAEDLEPLNLLLVPFPFHIPASAFRAHGQSRHPSSGTQRWGWFEIEQTWLGQKETKVDLRGQIAEFVCALLDAAEADVGRVHGIVLPEYSLDWECYAKVISAIQHRHENSKSKEPPVDFLVAGLSCTENQAAGNYVSTTTFSINDHSKCVAATYRRHKHHRWQLNGSQISEYALGSALDPNVIWWEAAEIPNREVNLTVFRRGAVFSAMICEDLARSEPCHEPLRAVGPNLVFVILMDGPQLPARWASRYATSLADDPGSSVLTLTSLGLIGRSNDAGRHSRSRHVSIWKDDSGHTVQLDCPEGAQAILVTLSGSPAEEATLDGRPNNDTQAWRYRGHQTVRLKDAKRFGDLLFPHG